MEPLQQDLLPSPFSLKKVAKFMFDYIFFINKDLYISECIIKFDKIINRQLKTTMNYLTPTWWVDVLYMPS